MNTPSLVIDPAEEKLKAEFAGVQRLLLPMHAVMRIEEVEAWPEQDPGDGRYARQRHALPAAADRWA